MEVKKIMAQLTEKEITQTAIIAIVSIVFDLLFFNDIDINFFGVAKLLALPFFLVIALNFNKKTLCSLNLLNLLFMTFIWLWVFSGILSLFLSLSGNYY